MLLLLLYVPVAFPGERLNKSAWYISSKIKNINSRFIVFLLEKMNEISP